MKIKDSEQFTLSLVVKDAKGNLASIDPAKTIFALDNPALATLTPSADGLNCNVAGAGIGSGQVQFSVTDLNNSADVQTGRLDLEVVAGDVALIEPHTSAPVPQA